MINLEDITTASKEHNVKSQELTLDLLIKAQKQLDNPDPFEVRIEVSKKRYDTIVDDLSVALGYKSLCFGLPIIVNKDFKDKEIVVVYSDGSTKKIDKINTKVNND